MTVAEIVYILERLARTQRNLPLLMSENEHRALREAASFIRMMMEKPNARKDVTE